MTTSPADPLLSAVATALDRAARRDFVVPAPVRMVAARLPAFPPAAVLAVALTLAAPRLFGRDGLAALAGKRFRIAVTDAGASVALAIRATHFAPLGANAPVDVTFRARTADYLQLAARRVDPDTLFFERRLAIEGDTETGLRLKNLLDAVEWPAGWPGG